MALRRLPRFQFGLRTLLIGATLVAILLGGFVVYQREEIRRQKAAIAALKQLGAEIYSRPQWQHTLLDPTAPGYVVGLALRRPERVTDDAELAPLADLSELVWLDLDGLPLTDASLSHIAGLKKLERLKLEESTITDAGLAHIAHLPKLRVVSIYKTQISDAGLEHLAKLPAFEELHSGRTRITPEALERLRQARPTGAFQ
jgi:Leucine-rich repeat (LRR) protein